MRAQLLSSVWLFATPWTIACQAPPPWDSPGKNVGVSCHFLLQGIYLPNPGIEAACSVSPPTTVRLRWGQRRAQALLGQELTPELLPALPWIQCCGGGIRDISGTRVSSHTGGCAVCLHTSHTHTPVSHHWWWMSAQVALIFATLLTTPCISWPPLSWGNIAHVSAQWIGGGHVYHLAPKTSAILGNLI